MSTFKCGLRRFDGHGTRYTERPVNTEATRQMESALERLRRSREAQDSGSVVIKEPIQIVAPVLKQPIQDPNPILTQPSSQKTYYSLSDSTSAPK